MFLFHFTDVYSPEFQKTCMDLVIHLMDTLELVKKIRLTSHSVEGKKEANQQRHTIIYTLPIVLTAVRTFANYNGNPIKLYD